MQGGALFRNANDNDYHLINGVGQDHGGSAGDQVEYPYHYSLLREKAGGGYDLRHKDGKPY